MDSKYKQVTFLSHGSYSRGPDTLYKVSYFLGKELLTS